MTPTICSLHIGHISLELAFAVAALSGNSNETFDVKSCPVLNAGLAAVSCAVDPETKLVNDAELSDEGER
jgi:hypothetical protein